jgi:hypothetical protein
MISPMRRRRRLPKLQSRLAKLNLSVTYDTSGATCRMPTGVPADAQ